MPPRQKLKKSLSVVKLGSAVATSLTAYMYVPCVVIAPPTPPSSLKCLYSEICFCLVLMLPTLEMKTTHKFNGRKGVEDEVLEFPLRWGST